VNRLQDMRANISPMQVLVIIGDARWFSGGRTPRGTGLPKGGCVQHVGHGQVLRCGFGKDVESSDKLGSKKRPLPSITLTELQNKDADMEGDVCCQ
jgi:hypothetical protein